MKLTNKKTIIILILIILIQMIFKVYVGTKKEYFHMDEAYSYGLMNYDKLSIVDNEDFLNNWHSNDYYLDYFEVNQEEAKNLNAVYDNQKNDVHPPLYYLLLRISASFTIDEFTKWTGLILNIVIFGVSSIFIYMISNKLFKKKIYALIVTLINGFTLISLDSSMYIRMYELANLMVLITTYAHIKLLEKEDLKFLNLLFLSIALILGGLTHYYFFIYAIGLYLVFSFKWIKNKKYMNWIKYTIAIVVSAIIYILIWPHAINHVFFGYRGIESNVNGLEAFFNSLAVYLFVIINRGIFNYMILFILLAVWIICKKGKKRNEEQENGISFLVVPVVLYLLAVAKNSPYIEIRYIIPIYSAITIIYIALVKQVIQKYWDDKQACIITFCILMVVLISPILTNTKLEMTYTKYNNIAKRVEESNLPIVYVFNTNNNRILDDIYLLTLTDKSIVLDDKTEFLETIKEQNSSFILICNEGVDEETVKQNLSDKKIEYAQRMNACNIYFVYNQ